MTQPTGVFVRLPLSEAARELLVDAAAFGKPDDSHDQAVLSIGTPVTGGDAQVAGWCHPEQLADLHIDNGSPDSERFVVMSRVQIGSRDIALIRQPDVQSAIAALEAEVGRLRKAMEAAREYGRKGSWSRAHVVLHKALKGPAV